MSTQDAFVMVFSRNVFYKRLHFLALGTFALLVVVIGVLIGVLYYLMRNPPRPLYFATDSVGRLIQIIPVTQPNMSTDAMIQWATEAVENTYSYDFFNYRAQMQGAQKYFTPYGWSNYMNALTLSNNLPALLARKQIVTAKVVPPVKVVAEGILGGAYAYKLQMQVLLTYWEPPFDNQSKFVNPLEVTAIVQRQPTLQSDNGLAIVQLVAQLASAPPTQPQEISSTPNA